MGEGLGDGGLTLRLITSMRRPRLSRVDARLCRFADGDLTARSPSSPNLSPCIQTQGHASLQGASRKDPGYIVRRRRAIGAGRRLQFS